MTGSRLRNSKYFNGRQFVSFSLMLENWQLRSTSNVPISKKNYQAIQKSVLEEKIRQAGPFHLIFTPHPPMAMD